MRLSAGRIRSINRAIARANSPYWPMPDRKPSPEPLNAKAFASTTTGEFVKVVAVPKVVAR